MRQTWHVLNSQKGEKIKCFISDGKFLPLYRFLELVFITIWTLPPGMVSTTFKSGTKTILKRNEWRRYRGSFSSVSHKILQWLDSFRWRKRQNNPKASLVTGRKGRKPVESSQRLTHSSQRQREWSSMGESYCPHRKGNCLKTSLRRTPPWSFTASARASAVSLHRPLFPGAVARQLPAV